MLLLNGKTGRTGFSLGSWLLSVILDKEFDFLVHLIWLRQHGVLSYTVLTLMQTLM